MDTLKSLSLAIVVAAVVATPGYAQADNTASAYTNDGAAVIGAAAARAGLTNQAGWTKVLSTTLQNSGTPKDLVIGVSFETMLFTSTTARTKGGIRRAATATAEIEMYVLVDGKKALPGDVTFDRRRQELWAVLAGVPTCVDTNGDAIVSFDECTLDNEEIGLILDTKAAHAFNFLAYNIGSGSHTIEAYARLSKNGDVADSANAEANASLGKGTLSVWEVHGSNALQ